LNTTTNISLAIADIIEHSEVPEGQVIRGHNMTFRAPVFGEVYSDGGSIAFENTFGWGSAVNQAGHIKASRRSFNATLQAPGGKVDLASAESCLIIGHDVTVQEAVNCQIFAHTLRIGRATGCLIAGRDIEIEHSKPYKQEPNIVTVVVPDLPDIELTLSPFYLEMEEMKVRVDQLTSRINGFKSDTALAHYLSIRAKVRAGMLKLTDDQSKGFLEMADRLYESAKALVDTVAERSPIAKALATCAAHVQVLRNEHAVRLADCRCNIARVDGETIVRQLLEQHDDPDLSLIPLQQIPKILFRNDASVRFLCAVNDGQVKWSAGQDA
jgi:hypothetical protein